MEDTPLLGFASPPASPSLEPMMLNPAMSTFLCTDTFRENVLDELDNAYREASKPQLLGVGRRLPPFRSKVQQQRSAQKRQSRHDRKLAAKCWLPQQPPVALELEPSLRAALYLGAATHGWTSSLGLHLRSPLPMARRLTRHFEGAVAFRSPPAMMFVEVACLPATPGGLSRGARRVLEEPNAGGSSETSE
ncbi:unnamed protein product, partial [Polarella glacialis]